MIKSTFLTTIALTACASAQIKMPQPSPGSELQQTVGVTKFNVSYSRPGVKDREIYGDLVPYGKIWRTGANSPTKVSFDADISFGGKPVPAGEYVLFTIPGKDEWTVILYGDTAVPNAAAYDTKNDVARVTVKPEELKTPVENFTIGFDDLQNESATLELDWANVRVPVAIGVDTDKISEASIREAMKDMNSWGAGDYASAAAFFAAEGIEFRDLKREPARGHRFDGTGGHGKQGDGGHRGKEFHHAVSARIFSVQRRVVRSSSFIFT